MRRVGRVRLRPRLPRVRQSNGSRSHEKRPQVTDPRARVAAVDQKTRVVTLVDADGHTAQPSAPTKR